MFSTLFLTKDLNRPEKAEILLTRSNCKQDQQRTLSTSSLIRPSYQVNAIIKKVLSLKKFQILYSSPLKEIFFAVT